MSLKRNALGRGLDSLISMTEIQTGGSSAIHEIEITDITPNPEQPRRTFDEESLDELAASISELGIVQPLSVRVVENGKYQIIAGERRWRAARKAGLRKVPAYVRTASDSEVTEMALIENIQREDLNAIEVALAFRKLIDGYNLTQDRLSTRLGKKRSTIANHLRLLKLPAEIQLGLRDHKLEMGHARALLSVDDPKKQLKLYKTIVKDGLSVRRVEEMVKRISETNDQDLSLKNNGDAGKKYEVWAGKLESWFKTPVKISGREGGKGSITLKFSSDEEFNSIMNLLERIGS